MLSGDPTNSVSKSIGDFVEYLFNSNYMDKHIHSFLNPLKALVHRGCTLQKNFTKTHPAFDL